MGHLEAGNAAGIAELTRRAASAVVTSPAGQAAQVLRNASHLVGCFAVVLFCVHCNSDARTRWIPRPCKPLHWWMTLGAMLHDKD